jgi:hypothetical protein
MSDASVVAEAASGLGPIKPRMRRWAHLPLCVIDAVFSIGARYGGTARTVRDHSAWCGLRHVLEDADAVTAGKFAATEQSAGELLERIDAVGVKGFADAVRNRQRTSTRSGVLKAEAVRQYAAALSEHGVQRLGDVTDLLTSPGPLASLERDLARVPGHGSGVRVSYLWMLAGDDHHVKPDRMVCRWLESVLGRPITVAEAKDLVIAAAGLRGVTPWEFDHAIWDYQRARR